MTPTVALASLFGLGLAAAALDSRVRDDGPPMAWDAFQALCEHWARVWGLPVVILEAVGMIESSRRPGMTNVDDPRAAARGGSWGLFGMTAKTAADLLAKHAPLATQPVAAKWTGRGDSLHDPGLSALLASFYLATLWHHYSSKMPGNTNSAVLPTIAAYHQGTVPVDAVLAQHGDLATDLPPHGREYVAHATAAITELQSRGIA